MEGEQLALYDAHVQQMKQMLDGKSEAEFKSNKIQILAELTKLRQLCCDPALLFEDYKGESAKVQMCMDLIGNAVHGGHKVLLFSQFTTMLDRLAEQLKKLGIDYYMLTGSVNKEKRMQMVDSFNKDDVPGVLYLLKGRRNRIKPHRSRHRHPLRSMVERCRAESGNRPCTPYRAEECRDGLQTRLPGYDRGEDH